jgi:hypothetical protein
MRLIPGNTDRQRGAAMPSDLQSTELGHLGLGEQWHAEAAAARPHAGEMLTYLRGLLVDPSHPGIRRCALKLIDEIEESARAIPPAGRGDG